MRIMKVDGLVGLLCVLVASLALADTAMADADEWGGWNDVPDDLLEMTDESSMAELSERLDQLVRSGEQDVATGDLPEDVLDRWLTLLSTPRGGMDVVPLERMMQGRPDDPGRSPWGDSDRGDGPPANRPGQGQGGGPSNNPGQGSGPSSNPGQGSGPSSNPGQGGGPSNNPGNPGHSGNRGN